MYETGDTICAIATAPGAGGIAVIRISGPESFGVASRIFSGSARKMTSRRAMHGWIVSDEERVDEVVMTLFEAPGSFTGEDTVEISCHGSVYVQQKILEILTNQGLRIAGPGEFTMRAYLSGRMDLSQAEAVGDLIAAESEAAHRQAVHQMRGGFSQEINQLRERLIHFASLVELELDFAEEDVEFANREMLRSLVDEIRAVVVRLRDSFRLGNVLKNGVPVAILGAPNMGKSTLLNALLNEERAIVSEIAGTTRDTVEDRMIIRGVRFRFIDTAGIRDTGDAIEQLGIERSLRSAREASVILLLFDAVDTSAEALGSMVKSVREAAGEDKKVLLLANKMDKPGFDAGRVERICAGLGTCLMISARNKQNMEMLTAALGEAAELGQLSSSETIVTNARHFEALSRALISIDDILHGLRGGVTGDFLAIDIRKTLYHLGEITGSISADDLLHSIFSRFCIGK